MLDGLAARLAVRLTPAITDAINGDPAPVGSDVVVPTQPVVEPEVAPSSTRGPNADGGYSSIELEYPVTPRTRYGYDKPVHPQLANIISERNVAYAKTLAAIVERSDAILRIPFEHAGLPAGPAFKNPWLPLLDIASLYHFVVTNNPATYLEVGSGTSTQIVYRAIGDAGLRTRIVSIDPQPRAEIDALCDEVIRSPFETTDLSVFDTLQPGDIVFIDNSHRALPNSDVTVFFLEAMPRIPAGVLVQIHDIFLPSDYPAEWAPRFYSEQFMLAVFLMGGAQGWQIELPLFHAATDPGLAAVVAPLVAAAAAGPAHSHGGSFWLRRL